MLRSKQPPSLEYLRTSPVRGQLELQDPKTAKGWRYIQTTDTADEFKVLLPPHTASMYEQLLKLEKLELARKTVSWERILEIRHLKDRMVRKCQKLSSIVTPRKHSHNEPFTFQTIAAPADFRLKEMEKWFRQQQVRLSTQRPIVAAATSARPVRTHTHARSSCCARCAVSPRLGPTRTFVRRDSPEHIKIHPPASPKSPKAEAKVKARAPTPIHDSPEPMTTQDLPEKAESIASISSFQLPPMSPPPLPFILRRGGVPASELPPQPDEKPPTAGPSGDAPVPPPLRHRRSCIKRSNTGDSVKTVSWADDRELTDRIAKFTSAAQEADTEWEEVRQVYVHHMDKLDGLENQVTASISRLEAEAAHLRTVCESIRDEKTSLRKVVNAFGEKHTSYREKVTEVLKGADELMSLYGVRHNSKSS
ncbi:hypothetical protein V5O48_005611 [Marasmius crinis-equi]|uniref:Uncharacterized protein n=1 Tax=Marasmius crinis-equi TaxID=585013 RepID=A0ABR3FLR5_9AGAR